MGAQKGTAPVVEPIAVQTTFISGLEIENMGNGCFMFTCLCPHRATIDGTMEMRVEARHIMSRPDIISSMMKTAHAIGLHLAGELQDNFGPHAHH
jgi:hypothetical protein